VVCWLNSPASYSNLLNDYIQSWQQPHLLDTAAKEMLFSDKILFLEGQEDVGLLRKWAKENNKELKFDIFGYGVGGFTKFAAFFKLANDLGLEKVAAIYDNGQAESHQITQDASINTNYRLVQLSANDIRDKYDFCGSCTECNARRYGRCTSKTQKKSGCFDESGVGKTDTQEYADFCQKIDEIINYFNGV
jgi:predicted ATP-dependent endonuclease of OLD family